MDMILEQVGRNPVEVAEQWTEQQLELEPCSGSGGKFPGFQCHPEY